MGIIKRADLESYTRDAVPMDLGDLKRRGESIVAAAQNEAAQILKQAREDRQRLVDNADKVGSAKGYKDGLAKGLVEGIDNGTEQAHAERGQELATLVDQWTLSLKEWEHDRKELVLSARNEVIELAAQIASRVIKRVVDLDPEVVVDQLESVIETLVTPTDIRVRVHPGDIELLKRVMPAMVEQCAACNYAELVEDGTLMPGSCVISTKGGGELDASISTQLDRVVATLLPAHRGPSYDKHLDEDVKPDSEPESKDDAA